VVLKQESPMKCSCGQPMVFPEGEIRAKCQTKGCLAYWVIGSEGFWSALVPIVAKHRKLNHYERYMAWRNNVTRKKGGSRMLKKVAKSVRKVLRDHKSNKLDAVQQISNEPMLVDYLDSRNVGQRGVAPRFIRPFGMRR